MIPSIELANALDKAADMIAEDVEEYNFGVTGKCNLGYLVRAIEDVDVYDDMFLIGDYYVNAAENYLKDANCSACNLDIPTVLVVLTKAGLQKEDFGYMEFLGKPIPNNPLTAILPKAQEPTAEEAIVFFRNEAKRMREQLQVKIPVGKKTVEKVPVSVV